GAQQPLAGRRTARQWRRKPSANQSCPGGPRRGDGGAAYSTPKTLKQRAENARP
ncbi:unnamed protein product, partial [Tetraodon nigroviridis]